MIENNSNNEIRLSDLSVSAGRRTLLEDVNLTIESGSLTVIVGGSGTGKSVLLRILAGLLPPQDDAITWSGRIEYAENATIDEKASVRVGIVFQHFALFDELSAIGNVQFAIDHRKNRQQPPAQSAAEWLDELGVPSKTHVNSLSGGQQQRLAIARTLAADPDILLYDEPTSGLDAASGQKVAGLIQETQRNHQRTSIVVTHDYATLLPIAEDVLLLDSAKQTLVRIPKDQWSEIPSRMAPSVPTTTDTDSPQLSFATTAGQLLDRFFTASGKALWTTLILPLELRPYFPRLKWGLRFILHYLRLVAGASAWVYLALAGLIVGFTATYFTFRFLPFRLYTQPLLIDELLSSIGFALYRILVPILATVLIAARCGAAVAADVGVKNYGRQVDAIRTLALAPRSYLLLPIAIAFLVATPMLEWLAFFAARQISLFTFAITHPAEGPHFWQQHFYRNLASDGLLHLGWGWVLVKNVLCGTGTATIAYFQGMKRKQSARDVSDAITSTVLWATLFVLIVHFLVALCEF